MLGKRFGGVLLVLMAVAAVRAWGQTPPVSLEDQALDALRTRSPGEQDNVAFDNWIKAAIKESEGAGADPAAVMSAASRFAERFAKQYQNTSNTDDFKRRFVERTAVLFQAEYAKGADLGAPKARAMARVLLDFSAVYTREALLAGLVFPDQTVRYLSASGLTAIKDQIAADSAKATATLTAVVAAAKGERNDAVVAMVYQALTYRGTAGSEAVQAVLAVLDGRLATLRAGDMPLGRGELPAISFFNSLSNVTTEDKVRIVQDLATLLRVYVTRLASDRALGLNERIAIEEVIFEAESLLAKLVNPPGNAPNIREQMQKDDRAAANLLSELNRWIGVPDQDAGLLNEAPWNVPRGAP
jgi:hypothetical protein